MLFCDVLFYGHSYLLHGLSFVRRVCGCVPHCGYVLYPIGGGLSHCGYCQVFPPQTLYSHCGFIPSGVCVNFSVYGSFPMWYCVCKCINTKNLPTDFHWSMGNGAYPTLCIVGYGGMSVCRHCVSICFAYIIIIQFSGMKSNKKKMYFIIFNTFFLYLTETILQGFIPTIHFYYTRLFGNFQMVIVGLIYFNIC